MVLPANTGSVLPRGSSPSTLMRPTTCAPISTTSSGSTVPVALTVISRSPREAVAVRKRSSGSPLRKCANRAVPPASSTTIKNNQRIRFFIFQTSLGNRDLFAGQTDLLRPLAPTRRQHGLQGVQGQLDVLGRKPG